MGRRGGGGKEIKLYWTEVEPVHSRVLSSLVCSLVYQLSHQGSSAG